MADYGNSTTSLYDTYTYSGKKGAELLRQYKNSWEETDKWKKEAEELWKYATTPQLPKLTTGRTPPYIVSPTKKETNGLSFNPIAVTGAPYSVESGIRVVSPEVNDLIMQERDRQNNLYKGAQSYNTYLSNLGAENSKKSTVPKTALDAYAQSTLAPDTFAGVAVQQFFNSRNEAKLDVNQYKVTANWPTEAKEYLYTLFEESPTKALSYAKSVNTAIQNEEFKKLGSEHPLLSSIVSIPVNFAGGIDYAVNALEYGTGKLLGQDVELKRSEITDMGNSLRAGVADKYDWMIGDWDAFDFLYNTGMSVIDSATYGTLLGPTGASIVLGLQAASSATNDILDRGGSSSQAFWGGVVAGTLEGVFEKVSLKNLKSMTKTTGGYLGNVLKAGSKSGGKAIVAELGKNMAKSMGINATEEMLTEIGNIVYDTVANGEISNYANMVADYMQENPKMSETEARWRAAGDLALQVLEAGGSGALSGMLFGLGSTAVGSVKGTSKNTDVNSTDADLNKDRGTVLDNDNQNGKIEAQGNNKSSYDQVIADFAQLLREQNAEPSDFDKLFGSQNNSSVDLSGNDGIIDAGRKIKTDDLEAFIYDKTKEENVKTVDLQKIGNSEIVFSSRQIGRKIGKHAEDFGLNASNSTDRAELFKIIRNIVEKSDEIRVGNWRGQPELVEFYIKGKDVVVVDKNKEFITILKGGVENERVKNARKR